MWDCSIEYIADKINSTIDVLNRKYWICEKKYAQRKRSGKRCDVFNAQGGTLEAGLDYSGIRIRKET